MTAARHNGRVGSWTVPPPRNLDVLVTFSEGEFGLVTYLWLACVTFP